MITTFKQQAKDLFEELHDRVDWPTKDKVLSSTWTVVFIALFVGLFLSGADWVITWVMKFIFPHH